VSPWEGFAIDSADRTPVYVQLERGIRSAIASGRLAVGDQLPTVRQLAVELRVNANTVAKVYSFLERGGVLETRRGVGTFIAARTSTPAEESARRAELQRLITRFLAELSTHGFGLEEARAVLEEHAGAQPDRGGGPPVERREHNRHQGA
jgi:GntR family transcriptional regulator